MSITDQVAVHPLETYFGSARVARCPVYPLKDPSVFYVNPILTNKRLNLGWWPKRFPPCKKEINKILDLFAVTVIPNRKKPLRNYHAFDSGRCVQLQPHAFKGDNGRIYRDIVLKGVGPIAQFVGQNNFLNMDDKDGFLSLEEAYKDIAYSNILHSTGILVPLGLLIIDAGFRFNTRSFNKPPEICSSKASIYVRAMTTNARIFNFRWLSSETLKNYLRYELNYLSKVENVTLTSYPCYLKWFAKRLAQQSAKLQKIGYVHDTLHSQQICLDGTICDHEHEHFAGFIDDAKAKKKQPAIFASFVAHDGLEDNVWQILKRATKKPVMDKDIILEYYWNEYYKVYKKWRPPPMRKIVISYGLDKNNDLLSSLFGNLSTGVKYIEKPVVVRLKI